MFFVFDVETIPDFDLLRSVLEEPDTGDVAILERAEEDLARGDSTFLPPIYHQMVAWVGLWVDNLGNPKQKVSWNGTDEEEGLRKLFDALNTFKDFGLIHHNGRGFDLPLLTYRSMRHGMQMPLRLNAYEIKYRYSKSNIDLIDEFSNYGASSWPKLKHLGHLIGIPFKQTGEGDEVLDMYQSDELDRIEHYCYEDVMGTYIVWLQLKYTVGELDEDHFTNLKERALNKLKQIQEEK